jgi:citrate synthase
MRNAQTLENEWISKYAGMATESMTVDSDLYQKYDVKRGLRDINGTGVLVGLTRLGEVVGSEVVDGKHTPVHGRLYYKGIEINDLVRGFISDGRPGFEESSYLLLFGKLPTVAELKAYTDLLGLYRVLPETFTRDVILRIPGKDLMNGLARYILAMYNYDDDPDGITVENIIRQSMKLIACISSMAIYGYQTYLHYYQNKSLVIHAPKPNLNTAENILHMLRHDSKYKKIEAELLDLAMVLHAEHGGGNNSTFLTHVISSSGTDTYSTMASAIGSLKGPRHGGANGKVVLMMEDIKSNVPDWRDEAAIESYLQRILDREAFDRSGLIYGMGHAVYSLSDPRAVIFKKHVAELAAANGYEREYELYATVERLAEKVIAEHKKIYKGVCANIDFYSGFVYKMLNIPPELYTPIFAISRIVGWSAHRIEEIVNAGKIIRPAYKNVSEPQEYVQIHNR